MIPRLAGIVILSLLFCLPAQASCIAVIPAGDDHQFWKELIAGAEAAAAEENMRAYVRAPSAEDNDTAQQLIIDAALKDGCKGILLAPNSPGVVQHVAHVSSTGIPVVYFDRDMGGERISVVKTNNYMAGVLAAQEMTRLLGGRGAVSLLRMRKGVRSTSEREAGFLDTILANGITVAHDLYIGSNVGKVRENTLRLIEKGLETDGIFTPNEASTVGVMVSLKRLKGSENIHHIGFDYTPVLADALEAGYLSGLVVQQPYKMGFQGVKTLLRIMNGMPYEPNIDIPVFFYGENGKVQKKEVKDDGSSS